MKKQVLACVMALSMVVLSACGGSGSGKTATSAAGGAGEATAGQSSGDSYKIRVAHVTGTGSPYDYGANKFKELVEAGSGGRITVEVFAGDMTTDDVEGVEMTQNGNLEVMWASTGALSGYVSDLGVIQLPFLFDSPETVEKALTGEFGQTILKEVDQVDGILGLAFHEDGWRNILTKGVTINSVGDMKGVRMRSMTNEVCVAMYEALGATPISLSSGEIFTSIQNGVVDGQDNSVLYAQADGYIEAIDNICDIHHFYTSGLIVANQKWFEALSAEDQELIRKSAVEAGAAQRAWFLQADEDLIADYEAKGYTVTRPTDLDAWREAVQPVYDKMYKQYPEWEKLVNMIQE